MASRCSDGSEEQMHAGSILEYIRRDFTTRMLINGQLERERNQPFVHPFRERTDSEVSEILTEPPL